MTSVSVYSATHSVVYVADNILKSLKDILVRSGLDPSNLVTDWESNLRALRTWISSKDLQVVILEIFEKSTDENIFRWDFDIDYSWSADEGRFWVDTEQLKYHLQKAGIAPAGASYRLLLQTRPGHPKVDGWGPAELRSTEGMVRQSLGSTINHCGLAAKGAYWRKK